MSDKQPATRLTKRRPRLAKLVHCLRFGLVAALLLSIPSPAAKSISDGSAAPPLETVVRAVPSAVQIDPQQDSNGLWPVRDAENKVVALAARTLPAAKQIVGYRGPTEAAIVLDNDLKILSVALLESSDTEEHVDAVIADESFRRQFEGWQWGGPDADAKIDAVSGATLTSLALAEGVLKRIGGDRPSLVFPDPLTVQEVEKWFPDAKSIRQEGAVSVLLDDQGRPLGRVIRSGVFADDVVGYQGPTELLFKVTPEDKIESVRLRRSYDNEPYVDYVRVEAGFWALFENQSLGQLAQLDPEEAGIEGVSGATMTSLAVADTIVASASQALAVQQQSATENSPKWWAAVRWTPPDVATIAVLLAAGLLSRLRLFHQRAIRRIWLLVVWATIGLWAGNLVSLALVAGWSAEGVAWRLAPGLTAITAVTLLVPPLTKGNPYCNHLCPHGALQQWIKPTAKAKWRIHPSRFVTRWLSRLPGFTLVVAYIAVSVMPAIDLSSWEPFHAYLFRIAGRGSFVLAALTFAAALVVPMGYCRFGCPTGRLIDYLRRTATSDRIQSADYVAAGLLLMSIGLRLSPIL